MNGLRSAAGLVWRHQRLVWWIFAMNLITAWLGSLSVRATLSAVMDRSLESAKLVTGFDLSSLGLMLERPDVSVRVLAPGAAGAVVVFIAYLLFIDGGVVAVFLNDRKLSRAEFFENAGLFFWRMVRLALYSLIPFGLLAAASGGISNYGGKLSSDASPERLGFFVQVAGTLVVLLLALFVRMWFDLAQARVVRDNERAVLGVVWRSLKLALGSGNCFRKYIGIGVFATLTFCIGVGIWILLPHAATAASFVVLELVTITQIASRLWMKAVSANYMALITSESVWPPAQIPMSEAAPVQVIEVTDVQSPQPE
jgi:hypothetical protein